MKARRTRRADRRDMLVEQALHLFRKHGYHTVGIDDVGKAAGVTGPAIYRHFKGKDDLLFAVLAKITEDDNIDVDRIDELPSASEKVHAWVDLLIRVNLANPNLLTVWVHEFRHLDPRRRAVLKRGYLRDVNHVGRILRRAGIGRTPEEARVIVESMVWLARSVAFYKPTAPRRTTERLLRTMILGALESLKKNA